MADWIPAFLVQLAKSPNVSRAALKAGITRDAAYKYRREHPEFAALWDDAKATSIDALEGRAYRRAMAESDTLAIFLLKSHRPEVYAEKRETPPPATTPDIPIPDVDPRADAS